MFSLRRVPTLFGVLGRELGRARRSVHFTEGDTGWRADGPAPDGGRGGAHTVGSKNYPCASR